MAMNMQTLRSAAESYYNRWSAQVAENESLKAQNAALVAAAERAREILGTTCGQCDIDEAEGVLLDHCEKCCHKIVSGMWILFSSDALTAALAQAEDTKS